MYNTAPVIRRCMDSIGLRDSVEIIVIDDGSTDDGPSIVEEYQKTHPWVRLISQPNGGVSAARNAGISNARGKYICFVDADDYHMPNGLERIVAIAEEHDADIVLYEQRRAWQETVSLQNFPIKTQIYKGRGTAFRTYSIPDYYVTDAIYRLSIIKERDILFKTDLVLREDDTFKGMFYCHTQTIIVTDLPLYCYILDSPYSATRTKNSLRTLIESNYKAAGYRKKYIQEHFNEQFPYERLKYMRFVSNPKEAIAAGYNLQEYRQILAIYHDLDCYPLSYKWIHVAHQDGKLKRVIKLCVKTFLTNHPWLGYLSFIKRIQRANK